MNSFTGSILLLTVGVTSTVQPLDCQADAADR